MQPLYLWQHVNELFESIGVPHSPQDDARSHRAQEADMRPWPPSDKTLWKVAELQAMCKRLGLPISGNKADLIARLANQADP
eukprot:340380-Prorocentrum_minimum.AAC.1